MIELYSKEHLIWAIRECNRRMRCNDLDWFQGYNTGNKSAWTLVWDKQYGKSKARERVSKRIMEEA